MIEGQEGEAVVSTKGAGSVIEGRFCGDVIMTR
jgi:hypothetical protein